MVNNLLLFFLGWGGGGGSWPIDQAPDQLPVCLVFVVRAPRCLVAFKGNQNARGAFTGTKFHVHVGVKTQHMGWTPTHRSSELARKRLELVVCPPK